MIDSNPTDLELDSALTEAQTSESSPLKIAFKENDKKPAIYEVAKFLIEKYNIKTISGIKRREIFIYQDGIYKPGEDVLKMDIRNILEELSNTHHIKEIIETIKDLTPTDRKDFVVNPNFINLRNGVFNIQTKELYSHDPKYLFLIKIPITYIPNTDCPKIKKFLSDILDEDQIKIVQEWVGSLLYRLYFIKKALILVGEGDTGKTTLLNLFFAFLGEANVSGISLQQITHDKFASSNLYNKHLNLYDDLSSTDIKDNGAFKIATGGGVITGEKKFGDQFQFKNFAKLTFACNKIPDVKEVSDEAYFNRWMVLQFNRVIEEENRDKFLLDKITTPEELSGLLNFALEGLGRILTQQRFSYDKDVSEVKEEMLRSGSSIAQFGQDKLEQSTTGDWVSKDNMYTTFTEYCAKNNLLVVSQKSFGSRLPVIFPYMAHFKPKDPNDLKGKKQVNAWRNVRFKVNSDDTQAAPDSENW